MMTPLLIQFLSESRDLLQDISEQLLALEKTEDKTDTLNDLFRLVHTLKGNTGLFEFPDLTRVLHAAEDIMSERRDNPSEWDQALTDLIFDVMDYISHFCDSIEETDGKPISNLKQAQTLEQSLRQFALVDAEPESKKSSSKTDKIPPKKTATKKKTTSTTEINSNKEEGEYNLLESPDMLFHVPVGILIDAWLASIDGDPLWLLTYTPTNDCFFQGDDPLHTAMQAPCVLSGSLTMKASEIPLLELDPYQCDVIINMLSHASDEEIREHFRYVPDQLVTEELSKEQLLVLTGEDKVDAISESQIKDLVEALEANDFTRLSNIATLALELINPDLKAASALTWLIELSKHGARDDAIVIIQRLHEYMGLPAASLSKTVEKSTPKKKKSVKKDKTSKRANGPKPLSVEVDEEDLDALQQLLLNQYQILRMEVNDPWSIGRIKAAITVLTKSYEALGLEEERDTLLSYREAALQGDTAELVSWIGLQLPVVPEGTLSQPNEGAHHLESKVESDQNNQPDNDKIESSEETLETNDDHYSDVVSDNNTRTRPTEATPPEVSSQALKSPVITHDEPDIKTSTAITPSRSVKVDQEKIDRLMNLIGEMTVAKNALPFLAKRAEEQHGLRELAREIKEQHAVVNRISEEMQDAIMQIRMMPFSFISMRFPRLVRDISRRLGKEVQLVIEGEDTEADKNIIESLAEPLIHIVRNSLDHGIESAEVRKKNGKPASSTLTIRASQEADRVMIEIHDDGKGIDPNVIRKKALEKGMTDDATCQRMTDKEAVNLILLPGFSTVDEISDLSGRGVGMDAVRSAVEKVNGAMSIDSQVGKGTRIRISLPMSIAVTRVMIVESDNQMIGVPMDQVLETVRVPKSDIHCVKHIQTTVLRDRIVPLKSLNELLNIPTEQILNEEDEYAVLIARIGADVIGLVVDDFRESVDIIQKPMAGVLSRINAYSGAALIGDGSVLMVLNLKEIL
ncbi:MAG: two-component system chemotaxis sensor kinase CheA [Thalassolituus sp.]|jgi:two-component system chemotaxis sensor kinase CheA